MYMDAITLAAVTDELRIMLGGARIDTIIQPTEHAIALQCYAAGHGEGGQNRWLYLSAHPQFARAHVTALKPAKIASDPPAFVMLLRKYLEGARIEVIEQPRWERVIEITVGYRSHPDRDFHYRLIIEIMGRLSNIILCDEHGLILGSIKRVGAEVNRYRVIAPNVQYIPPPPQQRSFAGQTLPRLEPTTITAASLAMIAATRDEPASLATPNAKKAGKRAPEQPKLWQMLVTHLLGFSALVAREAVYRTTGHTETLLYQSRQDEALWEKLVLHIRTLAALYDTHAWQPQLVLLPSTYEEQVEAARSGQQVNAPNFLPVAFAPYALEQYVGVVGARVRQSPSINVLIDEYYAGAEWRDAMEGVRAPLRKALQTQRDRHMRKAELLQQSLAASEEAAHYRLQADLLLTYQHEVARGQNRATLRNFFEGAPEDGAPEETIPLDPRLDAVGNANRLYHKYHKLRRATSLIPPQIEENALGLATIEQLLTDLMLAETPAEVALVKAEVQAAGLVRAAPAAREKKAQKAQKGRKQIKGKPVPPGGGTPLQVQSRDGFTLLIGKNSRQNEVVTFHQATANDIWLHARGVPGAHVIIKGAGREVPRSTIEQAAALAAYYSQARGSTTAPVDYTLQRYVRHMKGGGPGMVFYERERTIYARPEGPA